MAPSCAPLNPAAAVDAAEAARLLAYADAATKFAPKAQAQGEGEEPSTRNGAPESVEGKVAAPTPKKLGGGKGAGGGEENSNADGSTGGGPRKGKGGRGGRGGVGGGKEGKEGKGAKDGVPAATGL